MNIILDNSPLNEVVLGVQFQTPLDIMTVFKIIDIFKSDFPIIAEQSLLPSVIDSPDQPQVKKMLNTFCSRKHLISPNSNMLIQVQPDRFLFNWRRVEENISYPRFDNIYDHFDIALEKLKLVIGADYESKLNQLELTYVDHVILEDFRRNDFNPGNVFNFFNCDNDIKNINLEYSIPFEEIGGVWNLLLKSALRKKDNKKLLVYESTCRGFLSLDIRDWFEKAHEIQLMQFMEGLTDEAKAIWKMKEE